jgi:hypothetical protein
MKTILENWQRFTESHTKEQEEELKTIVGELENASKMHASQAERIQQILDETDDDKLEEGEKKNCGCGQDPCKTYGIQEEKELETEGKCWKGHSPGAKTGKKTKKSPTKPGKRVKNCEPIDEDQQELLAIIREEIAAFLAEKKKEKAL